MSNSGQFALWHGNPQQGYTLTGEQASSAKAVEVGRAMSGLDTLVTRNGAGSIAKPHTTSGEERDVFRNQFEHTDACGGVECDTHQAHGGEAIPQATRREACQSISAKEKERVWAQVMAYARACEHNGFTVDGLVACMGGSHNHWAPRVTELVKLGRLRPNGQKRKTRAGRNAAVLTVKP